MRIKKIGFLRSLDKKNSLESDGENQYSSILKPRKSQETNAFFNAFSFLASEIEKKSHVDKASSEFFCLNVNLLQSIQ